MTCSFSLITDSLSATQTLGVSTPTAQSRQRDDYARSFYHPQGKPGLSESECGMRESNSRLMLGKHASYHLTNPALGATDGVANPGRSGSLNPAPVSIVRTFRQRITSSLPVCANQTFGVRHFGDPVGPGPLHHPPVLPDTVTVPELQDLVLDAVRFGNPTHLVAIAALKSALPVIRCLAHDAFFCW